MKTEQEVIEILRAHAEGGAEDNSVVPLREFLRTWSKCWAEVFVDKNADYYVNAAEVALVGLPGGIDAWESVALNISPLWLSQYNDEMFVDDRDMFDAFGSENFAIDTNVPPDEQGRLQFKILSAFYDKSQDDDPLLFLVPTTRPEFMVMVDVFDGDATALNWLHRIA